MSTRDAQGAFIALISKAPAEVEEIDAAESLPIHPRAEFLAALLLDSIISRSMQRQQAEEARLCPKVYRFSSDCSTSPEAIAAR